VDRFPRRVAPSRRTPPSPGLADPDQEAGCDAVARFVSASGRWATVETIMDDLMKQKILSLLDTHRIMTIATLRPDGWPQATTVGYVNEGLTLWFLCGLESQKAMNLARDNRVSLTIDHDTPDLMSITGLSMAARAHRVSDRAEAEKVLAMLPLKYPDAPPSMAQMKMPAPEDVALFRVVPEIVSVLDYTKGFAHTDLVAC
jgi:nitroimidazol reductase NimA-like FMN-containing flavoprotein (pyridoxamine 5'-phosphate oxidase superfamily)